MTLPLRHTTIVLIGALLLAACGTAPAASPTATPTATPTPDATPSPAPSPSRASSDVRSPAQAAALVLASDDRFRSITALQPEMLGQAAWYEASETGDGFSVAVTVGSGDCLAGCIDRHTWTYEVTSDGTVVLAGESGDEVDYSPPEGTEQPATIAARLVAGPTCPVEQVPPDPSCELRPVINADVVLRDPAGAEVGRGLSDADGVVSFEVPGGAYYLDPQPVEGVMGTADAQAVAVVGGDATVITLAYDTGIR